MSLLSGTVLGREGSTYRVLTPEGEVRAILRGKMKRDMPKVVVGDRVHLDAEGEGGVRAIAGVEERTSLLARRIPEGRGTRDVAANVDQVLVVTATKSPEPIPQLIDRLLVVAEANNLSAGVILNKVDLDPGLALERRFTLAGYPVYRTSAKGDIGLEVLRDALRDRLSVITGPSGAGKSSLLNALEPGLMLRVGEVSAKAQRGTHTTVAAVMVPLKCGGYLVDTPGFSEVGLWGLEARELAHCFPEFRPLVDQCKYADCQHVREPHCAVIAGVSTGLVAADRLESYRVLLAEIRDAPKDWE